MQVFGGETYELQTPPSWTSNFLTGQSHNATEKHWSRIPDFAPGFGDIKTVWELSRFQWLLLFARAYIQSGDSKYIAAANMWVGDWMAVNAVNCGPNWMCGQETAIRLIHLLLAEHLLQCGDDKSETLRSFVFSHCKRIRLTTGYARAQQNNHVISEAAALFVGGSWLELHAGTHSERDYGSQCRQYGTALIQRSVDSLVMADGSFAQYSTVYHRLLVDSLSVVEWWRGQYELPQFADRFYEKARRATKWLFRFTNASTGEVPNIGGNDGALVYPLSSCGHRDFRASVQLAGHLFCNTDYFGKGEWCEPLLLLGIDEAAPAESVRPLEAFPDGGFSIILNPDCDSVAFCRSPVFKFRPSQSDALHVDLWVNGCNLLTDAGTYSYAADARELEYFMGVASHNTCQFDYRDQMPRIGRFLFGSWLKAEYSAVEKNERGSVWRAAYQDMWGCRHARSVESSGNTWVVTDMVSGPFDCMTLRWRLTSSCDWEEHERGVSSSLGVVEISADSIVTEQFVSDEYESTVYLEKKPQKVLTACFPSGSHTIVTTITLPEISS